MRVPDPDGAGPLGPAINPNLTQIASVTSLPDGDDLAVTLSEDPRTGADYPGTDREIWRNTLDIGVDLDGMKFTSLTPLRDQRCIQFRGRASRRQRVGGGQDHRCRVLAAR